ncbi:Wzz/FepE/Etk N-terminal domain-containing protein [Piscinibacterium candidicorallinum]|uniref:Wzz/FepE/Etk N-terminal domain-containing protein n=1 Tax=Piscinibacterium candidicorallinum TaxID=1793872 RepID=A0ABV7H938_9BURK
MSESPGLTPVEAVRSGFGNADERDSGEVGLIEVVEALLERWKLLVIAPIVAGCAALGVAFLVPPTFTARTLIMPPQQQQSAAAVALQSLGALAGIAGAGGAVRSPADQYVALMQSNNAVDRLIDQHKLTDVYDVKFRSDARRELDERSRINVGRKDGLIAIEVDDRDPVRAAALANGYVDQLRRLTTELAVTEAQQRRKFFEKQLEQTRQQLKDAQSTLQAAGFTEGTLRAEPKAAAEAYARLRAEVTAAEVRLQTMRAYLSETSAEFVQAQGVLSALRGQLARLESTNTPASSSDYISKFRDFKYYETLFELFAKQFELARVDESREGALVQVVDIATAPERKSKPKRGLIAAAAAVLAFGVLSLFVLVRFFLARTPLDLSAAPRLRAMMERRRD